MFIKFIAPFFGSWIQAWWWRWPLSRKKGRIWQTLNGISSHQLQHYYSAKVHDVTLSDRPLYVFTVLCYAVRGRVISFVNIPFYPHN